MNVCIHNGISIYKRFYDLGEDDRGCVCHQMKNGSKILQNTFKKLIICRHKHS